MIRCIKSAGGAEPVSGYGQLASSPTNSIGSANTQRAPLISVAATSNWNQFCVPSLARTPCAARPL
jgi:hypothetical protein